MNNDKSQPEKPELPPDPFPDDAFLDSPVTGRTLLAVANLVAQDIDKPVTTRAFLEAVAIAVQGINGLDDETAMDYCTGLGIRLRDMAKRRPYL
jgi:hypothetical protein